MKALILISLALTLLLPVTAFSKTIRYVSPKGKDSNPGTLARPFKTINKCAKKASPGSTCFIRAGNYPETVVPNSGITISGYKDEVAVIDGTDPVTNWVPHSGNIWKANVTLRDDDMNQIFVNGEMMTEARWPNGNDLFRPNFATAGVGTNDTFLFDPKMPNINWTGGIVHYWSGDDPWAPQTGLITGGSARTGLIVSLDGASFENYIRPMPGGFYYLHGVLGALDQEREWHYDKNNKVLYLWAPTNQDPNQLKITAKIRHYAIDLSKINSVKITGVSVFGATITSDERSQKNTLYGISASYISHFTRQHDYGGYSHSYWYAHNSDSGITIKGKGNGIFNSNINYSAGSGIALGGSDNIVKNNLIRSVDYAGNNNSGIWISGDNQKISNNTIRISSRGAIQIDKIVQYDSQLNGIEISYNNISQSCRLARDCGQIYTGWENSNGIISHNWIHDSINDYQGPGLSGKTSIFIFAGVYLDEGASGWSVTQNVFWNNRSPVLLNYSFGGGPPTHKMNNHVTNNTAIGSMTDDAITINSYGNTSGCGNTLIGDNKVDIAPIGNAGTTQVNPYCALSNNNSSAPGATEMNASVSVGCNFAGCETSTPPHF